VLVALSELAVDLGLDRQAPRGWRLAFTRDRRTKAAGNVRIVQATLEEIARRIPVLTPTIASRILRARFGRTLQSVHQMTDQRDDGACVVGDTTPSELHLHIGVRVGVCAHRMRPDVDRVPVQVRALP